jgi:hypothetical protein
VGLKLQDPIAIARGVLNDTEAPYRYSDADLLRYANDALDVAAELRPSLFYTEGEVQCEVGKALQSVSYDDAAALVDVLRIKSGNAVLKTDRATMDAFQPGWMTAAAGAAQNWMPFADDPMRFFVTPPAPANQVLEVVFVRIPGEYAADEDTGLPTTLDSAIAHYIIAAAEYRNDEDVNSGRSEQGARAFAARLGNS